VVLACYLAAVFCWGFGLYGHGVYLTELHRLHGWPTALISGAITVFICSLPHWWCSSAMQSPGSDRGW
jgi:hypothetical protein